METTTQLAPPPRQVAKKASPSETLRQRLFNGDKLSVKEQLKIQSEIQALAQQVGQPEDHPYFLFSETGNTKSNAPDLALAGYATRPGHIPKLVLADLYEKKYGIKIHIQKHYSTNQQKIACLLVEKLEAANGGPVGLVLQTFRMADRDGKFRPDRTDDRAHVAPVIIQKGPKGIDVISLDLMPESNIVLSGALRELRNAGCQIRRLALKEPIRQADIYSCHTDALQVLKDALLEYKKVGGNFGEHYWNEYGNDFEPAKTHPHLNAYFMDLAPHLQKTAQISKAMVSSRLSPAQSLGTRVPSANPNKNQTLGEHRQRFSTYSEQAGKSINNFLIFKAYRNAFKVLDHLKSFPDAKAREEYLKNLQVKNGFD